MRGQSMIMKRSVAGFVALSLPLLFSAAGCQSYAKITWDPPKPINTNARRPLVVGNLAEMKRTPVLWENRPTDAVIGKHTVTVFALPTGNINTHETTPLKQSFDKAVRDALSAAGYELVDASSATADTPILRGEVNACWWWSYSWFWPAVVQGGENKVTLFLDDRQGKNLWKHEFSRIEPGLAAGSSYGFDLMIKWSMTKLVQDIVRECSSDGFKAALTTGLARAK